MKNIKSSIKEISSYWYNNAKLMQNVEIDVVMKTSDELYAFECKWTNKPLDKKNEEDLTCKALYLGENIRIGFFSKSRYTSNLSQSSLRFIPSDLFDL